MSATNRGAIRVENDFYPTPDWLTEPAIKILFDRFKANEKWDVLEPACGDLAMVKVLQKYFNNIEYSDIVEPYNCDFLKPNSENQIFFDKYDLIITNPPFSLAKEFVDKAMEYRKDEHSIVAMLLRVNFSGSQERYEWFKANEPSVYVSSKRPSFGKNKEGKKGTDNSEYAWFFWGEVGEWPEFGHLELDLKAIAKAEKEKTKEKRRLKKLDLIAA